MLKYIMILIILISHFITAKESVPAEEQKQEEEKFSSPVSINIGMNIVSRYIWRGLNINNSPNLQPAISFGYSGFTLGVWGSYALSNDSYESSTASLNSEIDLYASYSLETSAGLFTAIVTDYFFPQAGIKFGNFNDHDHPEGAGGHLFEAGLIYVLPGYLPLSFSGFYNFYNDAGNNTYFELACPFTVNNISLNAFIGGTTGSKKNPGYYSSENAAIINAGLTVSKEIKITQDFSLPVFTSFIVNPRLEMPYLVFGITL